MGGSSSTWIDATLTDSMESLCRRERCRSKYMGESSHSLGVAPAAGGLASL